MALNLIARGPAMLLRAGQPRLATFLQYAKVELTPPGPGQLGAVSTGFQTFQSGLQCYVLKSSRIVCIE